MLLLYSMGGIFSKLAGQAPFLSMKFFLCYGALILLMGVYALGWQQVIKRMPLTTAFANKAITVVWGIVWGVVFFSESITLGKIAGAVIVMAGVILYVTADGEVRENE